MGHCWAQAEKVGVALWPCPTLRSQRHLILSMSNARTVGAQYPSFTAQVGLWRRVGHKIAPTKLPPECTIPRLWSNSLFTPFTNFSHFSLEAPKACRSHA